MDKKAMTRFQVSLHDNSQCAQDMKRSLELKRNYARELGLSAWDISQEGIYYSDTGNEISITDAMEKALEEKRSIPPTTELPEPNDIHISDTHIEINNETTMQAAYRLLKTGKKTVALNFANGISPGGGFLHGARAQEEVLCRSSGLYRTLIDDPMYEYHLEREEPDSTDWIIYSPKVPVFREDDGTGIEEPWLMDIFTCAAPVASSIGQRRARPLLKKRILRILETAHAFGYQQLVLGAWGCGAFWNNPYTTAEDFKEALTGPYCGLFSNVVFAIADWSDDRTFIGPFREVFSHIDEQSFCRT